MIVNLILAVRRGLEGHGIVVTVPILGFPVSPDEAAGLFEVRSLVDVLFSPLDLGLHAAPSRAPFSNVGVLLLGLPLVRQLLVFMGEPDLFELLFFDICGRIVGKIVASALKLVSCREFGLYFAIGVERLEGWLVSGAFCLSERASGVRKLYRAAHFRRSCRKSSVCTLGLINRYIVDRAKLGRHQAVIALLGFGQNG